METFEKMYFEKRGKVLVENLKSRHFDAYYCDTKEEALKKALELIPVGSTVGWGGATSAQQIGLIDAVRNGDFCAYDRDQCNSADEVEDVMHKCLGADYFLTGANALSMDGQMVNIDGKGNRVAAIVYGPKYVIVVAGMNKVMDTIDMAVNRARTIAAPINQQRFLNDTPCKVTGKCADCKSDGCICNQILITRNCRTPGRIKFILVGDSLGF